MILDQQGDMPGQAADRLVRCEHLLCYKVTWAVVCSKPDIDALPTLPARMLDRPRLRASHATIEKYESGKTTPDYATRVLMCMIDEKMPIPEPWPEE